jgi:hypothetical protein
MIQTLAVFWESLVGLRRQMGLFYELGLVADYGALVEC